jgi:hypothetical protein
MPPDSDWWRINQATCRHHSHWSSPKTTKPLSYTTTYFSFNMAKTLQMDKIVDFQDLGA